MENKIVDDNVFLYLVIRTCVPFCNGEEVEKRLSVKWNVEYDDEKRWSWNREDKKSVGERNLE